MHTDDAPDLDALPDEPLTDDERADYDAADQRDALFARGVYDDDTPGLSDDERIAYAEPTSPL